MGYFAKPLDTKVVTRLLRLRRSASGPGPDEPGVPNDAPLHYLVYQRCATTFLGEAELAQLLSQSRAFNAAHGLTGILLYSHDNGNIIQLLEGSEAHVRAIFARIAQDPRHTRVVKLADGPTGQRLFTQWGLRPLTQPMLRI